MSKKEQIIDLLIAVLLALIVVTEMHLAIKICQVDAETERVEAVMSEAQERIDAYYASLPARERPVLVSAAPAEPVISAAPAVEAKAPEEPETLEWYIEGVPLEPDLQKELWDACQECDVDYVLGLALIKTESEFDTAIVNRETGCYGLCQLNPRYFPSGLSPKENIRAGIKYLGELMDAYHGDVTAALRAYHRGHDDGDRAYSNTVLSVVTELERAVC